MRYLWTLLLIIIWACDMTPPTSPDLTPGPPIGPIVIPENAGPVQPVTPPATPPDDDYGCTHIIEGGNYVAICTNNTRYPATIYAVVYEFVGGSEQRRYDMGSKQLFPGESGRASAAFPDCGKAQGDTTIDHEPPLVYVGPTRLPGYVTGSGEVVQLGECPCEPVGDPECSSQTWDEEKCKWVGPCECVVSTKEKCILHPGPLSPDTTCAMFGLELDHRDSERSGLECERTFKHYAAAIVQTASYMHFIPNVQPGDLLCTCDGQGFKPACHEPWGMITYCKCPD